MIQQSIKGKSFVCSFVSLTWVQYGHALSGGVGANGSVNGLTVHPGSHGLLSISHHPVLHHSWNQSTGKHLCKIICKVWRRSWFVSWLLYLSLGSSRSEDNTGSGRSSSTSAGSTDSNRRRGGWWAGEHQGWSAERSASLEQVRRCMVTDVSVSEKSFQAVCDLECQNLNSRYTMSFTSRSESPVVSPGASMVQKYTPLSHHITSVMTRSASVDRHRKIRIFRLNCSEL